MEAEAFFVGEAAEALGAGLSLRAFPLPGTRLLRLAGAAAAVGAGAGVPGGETAGEAQCVAEARLLAPLLAAYQGIVAAAPSWNATALARGEVGVQGVVFAQALGTFNTYLEYHAAKTIALEHFAASRSLFDGWPLEEAERLFGLQLRAAWLALAPRGRLLPGHCACRYAPETQSLLFDAFDVLRNSGSGGFSFGLFQCRALSSEPDAADVRNLLPLAREPTSMQCLPADVIIRAACAQRAAQEGDLVEARSLMDAAVNLMALAADCFGHTPWTSGPESLPAAEVFYNWARFNSGGPGPWLRLPSRSAALARQAAGASFARGLCAADLGPVCVNIPLAELTLLGPPAAGPKKRWDRGEAFLHQCGDSYGDWRRVRKAVRGRDWRPSGRSGLIIHLSDIALGNLWHLLHVLLPALARRPAAGGAAGEAAAPPNRTSTELVVDGLAGTAAASDPAVLRGSLAWRFLRLLSRAAPVVLGDPRGPERRCYDRALWGHEAVTLFGRDKGGLGRAAARAAAAKVGRSPLFASASPTAAHVAALYSSGTSGWRAAGRGGAAGAPPPLPWRLLYTARPRSAERAVENEAEVADLLQDLSQRGRARTAMVDFAGDLARSAAAQWRLASIADVLVGPHGAGLAWAAFMAEGRVLVELMPHMRALDKQLCRRGPSGLPWDATPMYAYGGLCQLMGLRHVCLVGELPHSGGPGGMPQGLAAELATWHSSPIRVSTAALAEVLVKAFEWLDGEKLRPAA